MTTLLYQRCSVTVCRAGEWISKHRIEPHSGVTIRRVRIINYATLSNTERGVSPARL